MSVTYLLILAYSDYLVKYHNLFLICYNSTMKVHPHKKVIYGLVIALVGVIGFSIWGYFKYQDLSRLYTNLTTEKQSLEQDLASTIEEKDYIFSKLTSEQQKNLAFEEQIKSIASTVGTLDKLSKTDKELLQKYSKVYFLNEHYVPERLSLIQKENTLEETRDYYIHTEVLPFLEEMMAAAKSDGVSLKIASAYRSFGEQTSLKNNYKVVYGSGANQFSADQGYSEHQLGTTLDFSTEKLGSSFTSFANTDSYKWLLENAHRYGFILSYPENNKYYEFEPWHWRFVGKKLAQRLYIEKENFYDVEQRTIDNYLINIFNK